VWRDSSVSPCQHSRVVGGSEGSAMF